MMLDIYRIFFIHQEKWIQKKISLACPSGELNMLTNRTTTGKVRNIIEHLNYTKNIKYNVLLYLHKDSGL